MPGDGQAGRENGRDRPGGGRPVRLARGESLFKGYPGKVPFPAVTCISLNEQVVHGIPGPRVVQEGDLVKIDTACKLNGWCADAAITMLVGEISPAKERLLAVGEQVLRLAMVEMGRRCWWSEVATAMQRTVESAGFSVVTQYVGHGIGRIMHEAPQVPNFVNREMRKHDFRLEEGLVLAVEPMVNMRRAETDVLRDHWTVVTRGRSAKRPRRTHAGDHARRGVRGDGGRGDVRQGVSLMFSFPPKRTLP